MKRVDGIIFDMDGVLIDVSRSYRLVIEKTVNYFLEKANIKKRVAQKDISLIKTISGFNNDWDVSFALIQLVRTGIRKKDFIKHTKPLPLKTRDTKAYQEIKDIFQLFYLGSTLYKKTEQKEPPLTLKGFIYDERCLISANLLDKLKNNFKLGIATSRPRKEALFAVQNFKLQKYFLEKYIIAQEDTKYEKPHPAPLLAAKTAMKALSPVYIGDSINDCIAAEKAHMPCVYIGNNKLGDYQIKTVNDIMEILS